MHNTMYTKHHYSLCDIRVEEHLKWLKQVDSLPLIESCCDICHCDCYSSQLNEDLADARLQKLQADECRMKKENAKIKKKKKKNASMPVQSGNQQSTLPTNEYTNTHNKTRPIVKLKTCDELFGERSSKEEKKRSKSVCSLRSHSSCSESIHYTRDCEILRDLLRSLECDDTSHLKINGKVKNNETSKDTAATSKEKMRSSKTPPPHWSCLNETDSSSLPPIRLSESMANLCLVPTVREAYLKVPAHDKRILNRMATKRNEQAIANENAWLARKYWENERYERELLKCEQMEEYKKAVRDKQFQDYLQTKTRLNEIAQRDLIELQHLKKSLQHKDACTRKRLQSLRAERDMAVNQKRCDDQRKLDAVSLQHEGQQLNEVLKKDRICERLTERLKRADRLRNQILENYLKRLRYDNCVEQLQHEEHWREVQLNEQLKLDQLNERISRKRSRSQQFVENRQKRNDSLRKTAKISQNLRQLVRSSVSPEGGVTLFGVAECNVAATNLCCSQTNLENLLLN
ncbi:uncharacterized protein LOC119631428 [Glossina fuscipes]|uniref:Uncharacterized protein LOC119631428 n=1 Tax=Glossina fuscipes TaxID=7396 RepID=A0A8U0W2Z4_9MUSC|nr:uncharacterized protein LOC119631428 [Glossina fuscipes]KAI9588718.1 hypothetical protein GQX74_004563 [Glossina fuscipes]